MLRNWRYTLVVTLLASWSLALPAQVTDGYFERTVGAAKLRWTEEELAAARPFVMTAPTQLPIDGEGADAPYLPPRVRSRGSRPSPPSRRTVPDFDSQLFEPVRRGRDLGRARTVHVDLGDVTAANRGVFDLDFSSSRVVPEDARVVYPYSTIGHLFFRVSGEGFWCSASVVNARVVLTAGHCVFSDGDFHEDFLFVPAYHTANDPFGTWEADWVGTTQAWRNLQALPHEADFGVLTIADLDDMRIGDVTGWLGYRTGALSPNHVHIVGYPGNHDSGEIMHRVASGASACCFNNSAIFGSDMRSGSSGSPFVQNFGVKARGQKGGKAGGMNRVVGVTSFLDIRTGPKYLGSSIPSGSFSGLIADACDRDEDNCTKRGKPRS